jgi:ABC-type glutathione transport system ATPase component
LLLGRAHDFLNANELSGREVQRVAIARALALGPKLLIADEPTSALDPSVKAKILKLLMNLQDRIGLAMIFITHDIALARKISDRVAVMHKGRIVEEGLTNEILIHSQHPYTRRLVDCASGRYETMNGEIALLDGIGAEIIAEPGDQSALERYC